MDFGLVYGVQNVSFFDSIWAPMHFLFGFLIGILLIRKYRDPTNYVALGIGIMAFWEAFEALVRYFKSNPQFLAVLKALRQEWFLGIESYINVISDLVLGGIGLLLVYYYLGSKSVLRVPVELEDEKKAERK